MLLDSDLMMAEQVNFLCRSCINYLRYGLYDELYKSALDPHAVTLVLSLILTQLDYCNSIRRASQGSIYPSSVRYTFCGPSRTH